MIWSGLSTTSPLSDLAARQRVGIRANHPVSYLHVFHRFHWYTQHTNEWGPLGEMTHEHRCCRTCSRQWGRLRASDTAAGRRSTGWPAGATCQYVEDKS